PATRIASRIPNPAGAPGVRKPATQATEKIPVMTKKFTDAALKIPFARMVTRIP
ncbi:unnamed protein product, partial [marine sediment metagenome]